MPKPILLGIVKEAKVRVCHCPECHQVINAELEKCPQCSTAIDRTAALADAELTESIAHAFSESEYLRIAVTAPLIAMLAGAFLPGGFLLAPIVAVIVLVLVFRWWRRYGGLKTDDPDFRKARLYMIGAVCIGIFFFLMSCGVLLAAFAGDQGTPVN